MREPSDCLRILKVTLATDNIDGETMDDQLNRLSRSWTDSFHQIAERALGKESAKRLWQKYQSAFPSGFHD